MKKTDINEVRNTSVALAYTVPIKDESGLGVISHPFTNTVMAADYSQPLVVDGQKVMSFTPLDLRIEENKEKWLSQISETIKKEDLLHIYMMVNTPYKLTWLKFCKDYMSIKDFTEYFANAWVLSENPNGDINVTTREMTGWYRECPKEYLMVEEDKAVYDAIPEEITLYRGVAKNRNPYGLSYTASHDKAVWFMNRWYKGEGYIITLNVKKKDILAYFNTRNEDEYVVDTTKYKKEIEKQIPDGK